MRSSWTFVATGCLGVFTAAASVLVFSPLLVDIAEDLSTSVSLAANIFVVLLVANGIGAYAGGRIVDRWGRRVVMIGCMIFLAFALCGASLSQSLLQLSGWVAIAGLCCGACIAAILAEVSVRVHPNQRGTSTAWNIDKRTVV